ncbi:penicillin acylase family protein [Pseudoalteromonas fenneropenaei]|uniref:Penicillin acylase family protein n=1 Tax=Pseudoalteromonas fenneropenaei TaxID=1737459 RepID=A0ABV7CPB6_9GAMM
MLMWIKRIFIVVMVLLLALTALIYGALSLSLPTLDGQGRSNGIKQSVIVERDQLGTAVITASSRADAAFGLGYAHGQDRFFQMDLLRRNAAGELSELFGSAALKLDESMRFHQLRARSTAIFNNLPADQQQILQAYSQGVNEGRAQVGFNSFEYLLTGADIVPWRPEDSLLCIFSMYLDLQTATYERDEALIYLDSLFGQQMREFVMQPSNYQAALDGSIQSAAPAVIPELQPSQLAQIYTITEPPLYGSNNWAVTGTHTATGAGMLSDDMHLSLNVPAIWYRAQLNYPSQGQNRQVTGVSLPGAPAIVVGSNNEIAWGFTNGYLDTADWIALNDTEVTQTVVETIALPKGQSHRYELTMSQYGPVKRFNGQRYALSWVAHQPYALNLKLLDLEGLQSVEQAIALAPQVGIPVQNLMVVDSTGNAGWRPMGALPARTQPSDVAVASADYDKAWQSNELLRPSVINPPVGKLWTGNSRVMSVDEQRRFGDGGYALGARSAQIRDRLAEKQQFNETDFNALQHDNEARFLQPWHKLLVGVLNAANQSNPQFAEDLQYLAAWGNCACAESVGYTLVKRFRDQVIDVTFAPVESQLRQHKSSLKALKRYLEPAMWQLLTAKPQSWLQNYPDWSALLLDAYQRSKSTLSEQHGAGMAAWQWGKVNALQIQHPFSKQIPLLSSFLDMPEIPAFGDTFMPAVQGPHFGASQRFIAQPGHLDKAILTMAGGQSGHPLSSYYRAGFVAYAKGEATPLLPGAIEHRLTIVPQ